MEKILMNIKNSKGYVSIETLIVAGLIIGFGAFLIAKFVQSGKKVGDSGLNHVNTAQTQMDNTLQTTTAETQGSH